ncbi:hypothetical protein AZOA_17990 [Azoarcus sp. Aa7]|nr:hypothetical protein [Azoarcus sp. Aa7]
MGAERGACVPVSALSAGNRDTTPTGSPWVSRKKLCGISGAALDWRLHVGRRMIAQGTKIRGCLRCRVRGGICPGRGGTLPRVQRLVSEGCEAPRGPPQALRRALRAGSRTHSLLRSHARRSPACLSVPYVRCKRSRTGLGIVLPPSYREPPGCVTDNLRQNSDWFIASFVRNSRTSSPLLKRSAGCFRGFAAGAFVVTGLRLVERRRRRARTQPVSGQRSVSLPPARPRLPSGGFRRGL